MPGSRRRRRILVCLHGRRIGHSGRVRQRSLIGPFLAHSDSLAGSGGFAHAFAGRCKALRTRTRTERRGGCGPAPALWVRRTREERPATALGCRSFWDFGKGFPLCRGGMGRQTPPRDRRSPWPGVADGDVAAWSLSVATRETRSSAGARHAARPGGPLIVAGAVPVPGRVGAVVPRTRVCHRGFAGWVRVRQSLSGGSDPGRGRQSAVTSRSPRA